MGQCWGHITEDTVFDVGNFRTKKKFELYDQGIVLIKDIPDEFELSDKAKNYYRVGVLTSGMHTAVLKEINSPCECFFSKEVILEVFEEVLV